jgi:hypothetical protein
MPLAFLTNSLYPFIISFTSHPSYSP